MKYICYIIKPAHSLSTVSQICIYWKSAYRFSSIRWLQSL